MRQMLAAVAMAGVPPLIVSGAGWCTLLPLSNLSRIIGGGNWGGDLLEVQRGMVAAMEKKRTPGGMERPKRGRGRPKIDGRVHVSVRMPKDLKTQFKLLAAWKGNALGKDVLLNDLWIAALSFWWEKKGERLLEKYRVRTRGYRKQ